MVDSKNETIEAFLAMFSLVVDARDECVGDETFCEALRGRDEKRCSEAAFIP
jgi:hypothetical protein